MSESGKSLLQSWLSKSNQTEQNSIANSIDNVLSFGEERLYFLGQSQPDNPFYHYAETNQLSGNWDESLIHRSIEFVCHQNEILSENYVQNSKGDLTVIKTERKPVEFEVVDTLDFTIAELKNYIHTYITKPFDLEKGILCRYILVKQSEKAKEIHIALPHLITDKWSMQNFREQWRETYLQLENGETPTKKQFQTSYRSFASQQRKETYSETSLEYWKEKLKDIEQETSLPFSRSKPSVLSHQGSFYQKNIENHLSQRIKEFISQKETTYFTFFLSVFTVLLYKYSNHNSICIGTPVSTRSKSELEEIIGFFNETIALKTDVSSSDSFLDINRKVSNEVLTSFDHRNIPFQKIVQQLDFPRTLTSNPFFSTMFLFHKKEPDWDFKKGRILSVSTYDLGVAKFDFTIYVEQNQNDDLQLIAEYSTDLLQQKGVEIIVDQYCKLIEQVLDTPTQSVEELTVSPANIKQDNDFIIQSVEETVVDQIESFVSSTPDAIAISDEYQQLSYQGLNEKANRIANSLFKRGVQGVVGVYFDRTADMVVAILGVLKAGCSYLPLDPHYPTDRLSYMVKDSECVLILSHSSAPFQSGESFTQTHIDALEENTEPVNASKIGDDAYLIYTSGSSGQPKAVQITHRNLWHSTQARKLFYDTDPSSYFLLSSFSFDSSVAGIFWTLTSGGKLVISAHREEQNISSLLHKIDKEEVTHTLMLPSLYELLLDFGTEDSLQSLQCVIVAGEVCKKSVVEKHFSLVSADLYNEYGPTEVSVWSIAHKVQIEDLYKDSIPIGKPIPFVDAYIISDTGQSVPRGVPGQLVLGGPMVSKGYFGYPNKTKEAFVTLPVLSENTLYKTGDLVRVNEENTIEFLGRVDQQIKIRGYRVELGEIETKLEMDSFVEKAVVLYDDNKKTLNAYLQVNHDSSISEIKQRLRQQLPDYMVPSSFFVVDDYPLLPNGKIDRNSLLANVTNDKPETVVIAPTNDLEKQLLAIWKSVLQVEEISVTDNFFSIGGDSLLSIRVNARARELGIPFSTNQLFIYQTIRELAAHIAENQSDVEFDLKPTKQSALSPIQEWFFATHKSAPNHWHQIFDISFHGKGNPQKVEDSLRNILNRHQALSARFIPKEGIQVFEENAYFKVFSISGDGQNVEELARVMTREIVEKADIHTGKLFQALVIQKENNHVVRIIAHHLVVDAVSIQNIIEELIQGLEGKKLVNENSITQYSNFVNNQQVEIEFFEPELAFWNNQESTINIKPTVERDIITIETKIDSSLSDQIVNEANLSLGTKAHELLLANYWRTIHYFFPNNDIVIGLENHGRESHFSDLNLSLSVGWFTSFFPRKFSITNPDSPIEVVKQIKDQYRAIPNSGQGYGLLQGKSKKFDYTTAFPFVFNFLGSINSVTNTAIQEIKMVNENARDENSEVYHIVELNAFVVEEQIQLYFRINPLHIEIASDFVNRFSELLGDTISKCMGSTQQKTVSDFDVEDFDSDDLDELLKNFDL